MKVHYMSTASKIFFQEEFLRELYPSIKIIEENLVLLGGHYMWYIPSCGIFLGCTPIGLDKKTTIALREPLLQNSYLPPKVREYAPAFSKIPSKYKIKLLENNCGIYERWTGSIGVINIVTGKAANINGCFPIRVVMQAFF